MKSVLLLTAVALIGVLCTVSCKKADVAGKPVDLSARCHNAQGMFVRCDTPGAQHFDPHPKAIHDPAEIKVDFYGNGDCHVFHDKTGKFTPCPKAK